MDSAYHSDSSYQFAPFPGDGNSAAMSGCPGASGGFQSFLSVDPSAGSALSALLERREQLLNDCMALRFRMESVQYVLPPDMLHELITIRDRLFETDDTVLIGRLSSRLSCYMQQISARLDALELAVPVHRALHGDGGCMHAGACTKRDRTGSDHSAHSGSGSDVGERSLDGHESNKSKRRSCSHGSCPAKTVSTVRWETR